MVSHAESMESLLIILEFVLMSLGLMKKQTKQDGSLPEKRHVLKTLLAESG